MDVLDKNDTLMIMNYSLILQLVLLELNRTTDFVVSFCTQIKVK
jgi:hypothetical protein